MINCTRKQFVQSLFKSEKAFQAELKYLQCADILISRNKESLILDKWLDMKNEMPSTVYEKIPFFSAGKNKYIVGEPGIFLNFVDGGFKLHKVCRLSEFYK